MQSERIQRRIDSLLDQAEDAIEASDWKRAQQRAEDALRLDPDCADARSRARAQARLRNQLRRWREIRIPFLALKGLTSFPQGLPIVAICGRVRILCQEGGLMSSKSRFKLVVHEDKCTGCRTCQYRCAWRFDKGFGVDGSAIIIHRTGNSIASQISFTSVCDSCGLCARACPYGTLELVPQESMAG